MSEETLTYTFTRLRKRLQLMARRILQNDDDVDDILQDAFCRLWPKKEELDDPQKVQAMTTTTIHNLCIDKLRQQQRHPTTDIDTEKDAVMTPSPSDSLEVKERFLAVERIIETVLTPLQREIIYRREYEEEGYAEIARALQMQETAVRMQLSRARKMIRSIYQKQNDEKKKESHIKP